MVCRDFRYFANQFSSNFEIMLFMLFAIVFQEAQPFLSSPHDAVQLRQLLVAKMKKKKESFKCFFAKKRGSLLMSLPLSAIFIFLSLSKD